MAEFRIGASYYPEWWDENQWEEDFSKMETLGFNTVRMGEFAWSWFEPEEGKYNFEPMIRAVDCAGRHNIKVIMGTVTAICPPWLHKKYPEVKGANEKGPYTFGGRKGLCLSSRIFLEYAKKITAAQAGALGQNQNIIGWQLDNEPGCPFYDYSSLCDKEFSLWLKEKYGNIDELNKAWFGMMWSNYYTDFDEIHIPVNAAESGWTLQNQLDYRKFFSFTFNRLLSMEAEIIRKYSPGRFLYTNWPGANWSVNCYDGEKYLDYAAWDNYVSQPNGDNYRCQLKCSMEHSFDRRLSNGSGKFLIAEQHGYVEANTRPDVIRAQTWWNIAHGAFGTLFFEWRMPTGGAEQDYESVMDREKKVRPETEPVYKKLIAELKKTYHLIDGAETESDIAFLYSYENSWGTGGWKVDGFYDTEIFNSFGGFKNSLNVNIDIASISDNLSKYKMIVMPNFRIVTDKEAEKIRLYVENGGIVVMNTVCGTRDIYNKTLEINEPGLFKNICGAEVSAKISAKKMEEQTGEKVYVVFPDGTEENVTCTLNRLELSGAEPVAFYTTGKMKHTPAVTINAYGKGYVVLYATDGNSIYFYEALANMLKDRFAIKPMLTADEGILCASRTKNGQEYIIAVNMKERTGTVKLQRRMYDHIRGKNLSGSVKLDGYGVLMLSI